mgnify:FL=1
MALASSGVMSIGGTTTNRSINLELSLSATQQSSLGQSNFRSLAGVASGAISMSDFYGASSGSCVPISLYYDAKSSEAPCSGEGRPATYYIDGSYGSGTIYNEKSCAECTAGVYGDGNGKSYAIVSSKCVTTWYECER